MFNTKAPPAKAVSTAPNPVNMTATGAYSLSLG